MIYLIDTTNIDKTYVMKLAKNLNLQAGWLWSTGRDVVNYKAFYGFG